MANTTKSKVSKSAGAAANDSMLKDFFQDEIKDIYWAEKNILKALPKMKKAATSSELQNAFEEHYAQTQTHVERVEKVFALLEKNHRQKNAMPWQVFFRKEQAL